MKIIYIASLTHSGSTLLDLVLNAHPEMTSVGELKQLGRFARFQKRRIWHRCTCGADSLWTCAFWSKVNSLTVQATGQTIGELNVDNYRQLESFQEDNLILFKAIAQASGKQYIVDSSKSSRRLKLLMETTTLDVLPIFLLRNPKGQVFSLLKKNKSSLRELIANYVNTNRAIYSILKDRPHAVVWYESLARHPEQILRTLMASIGLSFDPKQLDWAAQQRHNIGGNGMRRETKSEIKIDDRWRRTLTLPQKFAIEVGTLAGRYAVLKFGP